MDVLEHIGRWLCRVNPFIGEVVICTDEQRDETVRVALESWRIRVRRTLIILAGSWFVFIPLIVPFTSKANHLTIGSFLTATAITLADITLLFVTFFWTRLTVISSSYVSSIHLMDMVDYDSKWVVNDFYRGFLRESFPRLDKWIKRHFKV